MRILLLLRADCYQEAEEALLSAKERAVRPEKLTFGLSLNRVPSDADQVAMHAMGTVVYLAPGHDPWTDMEALWQGETYVLIGRSDMRFSKGWDRILLRTLVKCRTLADGANCVLTGCLPRSADPVDAVYPVAASRFDDEGRLHFQRGTPLRYALEPQRSAFLHPGFCFGPAPFFRMMKLAEGPRFMEAHERGWELYTLHRPVIHVLHGDDLLDTVAAEDCAGSENAAKFETRFGVKFGARKLSAMAKCGVFNPDLSFDSRVPLMVRAQEAFRNLDNQTSRIQPLCVTAWLTLPEHPLDERRLTCFRRMSSMKNLPLLCFTDNESARRVMHSHPHLQEYRQRHGLDVPRDAILSDLSTYIRLSKPFMLAQSREAMLRYSHYIWLDFDYLQYPVYERTALDWRNVCINSIVMAEVDGQLDPSMIVVPQELLEPLCREINDLCRDEWRMERPLPTEQQLWTMVYNRHPDWFHTFTLPGRHELLALTMPVRGEEYNTQA